MSSDTLLMALMLQYIFKKQKPNPNNFREVPGRSQDLVTLAPPGAHQADQVQPAASMDFSYPGVQDIRASGTEARPYEHPGQGRGEHRASASCFPPGRLGLL